MTERPKYVSLLKLAHEWAIQGGEPLQFVVRQICSWAMLDAFPVGSFVYANGNEIRPMDLYMSFQVAISGQTSHDHRWNLEVLQRTLVSKNGIRAFCERTETVLPPSVDTIFSRLKRPFSPKRHSPSPPRCPNVNDRVAQLNAQESAAGALNTLKSMLDDAQRKPMPRAPTPSSVSPPHQSQPSSRWLTYKQLAQTFIDECKDEGGSLQDELRALNSKWEKTEGIDQSEFQDLQCADNETTVVGTNHHKQLIKRSVGRPTGSGSYLEADLELVHEMKALMKPGSSINAIAATFAARAAGAGTLESKTKRLSRVYAETYPPA